jgi:hypothetical protein
VLIPVKKRKMNVSKSEGGRSTHKVDKTTAEMDRSTGKQLKYRTREKIDTTIGKIGK